METVVLGNQSLPDIAVQETGSLEGVFELAELAGLSITDELAAGMSLPVPLTPVDRQVTDYYDAHRITPATAITSGDTAGGELIMEGIEFWGIEYDFIVSGDAGTVS